MMNNLPYNQTGSVSVDRLPFECLNTEGIAKIQNGGAAVFDFAVVKYNGMSACQTERYTEF